MNLAPLIELEEDPVPIVMVVGAQLKRALTSDTHRKIANDLEGCFALSSTTDPQKVSVDINKSKITVTRGISSSAKIVVHLNFNKPEAKPRIDGLLRHPLFAINVGKLLEPPPQNWITEAKSYWQAVSDQPGMPASIKLVSTPDNFELVLGEENTEHDVIIHGKPQTLLELVNGSLVFAEAAMAGKIKVNSSVEHLVILTQVSIKRLLGEL